MPEHAEFAFEAGLLGEALGAPLEHITPLSREPLGDGSVAGFRVASAGGGGAEPLVCFVDTSRLAVPRETGLALDDAGEGGAHGSGAGPAVRIWQHPADPHLPALAVAAFPHSLDALLSRAGLRAESAPEMAAYRPGRRAVLRVECAQGTVWVKVVPPRRVERIRAAHAACERSGIPVPALLAWAPDGMLVLANAEGAPATGFSGPAERLLQEVDALRGALSGVETRRPARGVEARLDWYAERIDAASGAAGAAEAELVARIREALSAPPSAVRRGACVVHGDLHLGQLFLDPEGRIRGLIDVDTLGVGDAAEDSAAFLAHAIVSALMSRGEASGRFRELADAAAERWRDESRLVPFTAIHLLGHMMASELAAGAAVRLGLPPVARALFDGEPPSNAIERALRLADSSGGGEAALRRSDDENSLIRGFIRT